MLARKYNMQQQQPKVSKEPKTKKQHTHRVSHGMKKRRYQKPSTRTISIQAQSTVLCVHVRAARKTTEKKNYDDTNVRENICNGSEIIFHRIYLL